MACVIVPAVEAVITTACAKAVKAHEKKAPGALPEGKLPFSQKLGWLSKMLWGGSALLTFEHIWHGEIVPAFPFFTAADGVAGMLREMAVNGLCMTLAVTGVWLGMLGVAAAFERREKRAEREGA